MRIALIILSFTGLMLTILPAFLHFAGIIEFERHLEITTIGTILYLSTAPFWMNKGKKAEAKTETKAKAEK
jgi:hypothetical protein